ncbi:nuclear pore complex protein Nup154 [Ostrinia furnacalis]|uniref:nuclear pore complex protein Nup154 n=1 Tax=Ostrinia furnacalis TaxID=93504 RepID=UPI00103D84DE|nr:nuclear pore complex protein Nup154 [Ostrinia furnacalis]
MPSIVSSSVDVPRPSDGSKMQLECLELAGCTLDRYISSDNSRPSFLEITGIAAQRSPTCSGLNAGDYRNLEVLLNHPNLSQLKILNKVPLPPEIMEHFAHMQCHCLMGVFPEISRVWLAIDSNIYVWAFEHGCDVAYFDGLGETIVSVGLVKPKPGVFQSFVKYLLVLTTTVEIVVLGVTFSSSKNDGSSEFQEIHLVPEPVFVLPTDGVSMMSVKSTAKGRIFMGGKDGCLYEITYQAQLGWFGKHCKKVNHSTSALSFLVPSFLNAALYDEDPIVKIEVDNSRNILYTLSEKGCIEVFDLGADGEGLSRVVRFTQGKILTSALDIVKTLEPINFKPVVAISAVEESESEHLNLVAVTQTGARLYFSTGSGDANQGGSQRPQYLTLLHVRLPPGFTPNASVLRPKQVHSAVHENGCLVMVCSTGNGAEAETLWCLSRVLPGPGFSEAHSLLALDGPAWALTALPAPRAAHLSPAMVARKEVWSVSRWAVVTGAGAAVLAAGAAPDLLRSLLRDCRGPEAHAVKDFFQLHSVEQACACAVYLACEDATSNDLSVSEWAARAFFLYGAQLAPAPLLPHQTSQLPSSIGSPKFSPRQMSTPMSMRGPQGQMQPGKLNQSYQQAAMNQSFPGSPNQSMMPQSPFQQNMMSPTPFNQSSFVGNVTQQQRDQNFPIQVEYSAKHNGLYIYIGRILAPIWNLKCVSKSLTPDNKEFMSSNVTGEDCAFTVQKLQRAAAFAQRVVAPPHSDEHASLQALKMFITMAIEMLSLWKVLCEHQFHVIASSLPPEQQSALQAASFRELLVGGQEVACLLLGSLVAGYLRDNASVDGISQKLRQLCPTLYRKEDATCSKANELLMFAKQQKNPTEREEMLQHALKLCMDVAPNVNLPLVCAKLVSAGFYSGVVQLCRACAARLDPHDKALHHYSSDQPAQDREGHLAYYRRMDIYREVCNALERLYERSVETGSEPAPLRSQSQSTTDTMMTLSPADANYQGRKLVWECLACDDELLHVAVYQWLVSKNLGAELLSLGSAPPASLRRYLAAGARAASPQAALQLLDLLWKVLEKCGDHLAAAHVLEGLATKPGSGALLSQRISWLSAGVVCVRGAGAGGPGGGELLRRLEEAGEVARVQAAVRAAAAALPRPLQPPPHAMHRLDDELLEVTQLYEEYADRYNLWECKLAIVQCSGHNDALLVENIWSNILAEAEAAARGCLTADEKLGSVLSKLTTLGREYVHTGHCFPLYFIVRQLEIMSCKLQADQSMVFKAVLNIGVSLEQVLDIYIKLVSVNERVWLGCGDETHVCSVAALLLESARGELAPLEAAARRRALARCKDLHEAALSSLQVCTGRLRAEPRVCSVAALLLESARGELAPLEAAARRRALARCKDLHEAALSSLQVCTGRLRAEPRVCSVAALLLESARGELAPLEAAARRRALARCKDLHEAALSSLQARPNTQRLMDRLTVAQAHLDRLD